MIRNRHLPWLFATALAAMPQVVGAATVVKTLSSAITFSGGTFSGGSLQTFSQTFSFADLASADQLVSISGGSIFNPEGGNTLSIDVDYSNSSTAQIFSGGPFATSSTFLLSGLSNLSFASGTINGLTFKYTFPIAGALSIPAGTTFTFHVADAPAGGVPEPLAWVMMVGGFAMAGGAMRRLRRRAPAFSPG